MSERRATTRLEVKDADKAVGELSKVKGAQDQLTAGNAQAKPAVEGLTEQQEKLNATTSDYVGLLSRINPVLGAVVDGAIKATKILGDLATKQIDLSAISTALRSTLGGLAKAIKLLGAVGVAITGLTALYKAIDKIRQAAILAEEAIKKMIAARMELEQQRQAEAEAIAAESDKTLGVKPFTFEQEESARATMTAAPADIRDKLQPIILSVGGAKGFGPAPGAFTGAELESLARLDWKPPAGAPIEDATLYARQYLDRRKEDARAVEERRSETRETKRTRAVRGTLIGDPEDLSKLRDLVAEEVARQGMPEEDVDRLVKITRSQLRENLPEIPGGPKPPYTFDDRPHTWIKQRAGDFTVTEDGPQAGGETMRGLDLSAMMNILAELRPAIAAFGESSKQIADSNRDIARAIERQKPSVGYQINQGTDARSFRSRVTNGETAGRSRE